MSRIVLKCLNVDHKLLFKKLEKVLKYYIHPWKNIVDQNDVEFDFSIGDSAIVIFLFWIINQEMYGEHTNPQNW